MAKTVARTKTVKRTAAKKSTDSKAGAKKQARPPQISFACKGSSCTPSARRKNIKRGEVLLIAPANNVSLTFTGIGGSPFREGNPIRITKGIPRTVHVKSGVPDGSYPYTPRCSNPACGNVIAQPEMIVP